MARVLIWALQGYITTVILKSSLNHRSVLFKSGNVDSTNTKVVAMVFMVQRGTMERENTLIWQGYKGRGGLSDSFGNGGKVDL